MKQENTMTRTAIMEKLTTMGVPFKKKDSLQTLKDTLENALNERHYEKYGRPTENAMENETQNCINHIIASMTTKKEEENTMNTENTTPATENVQNNNTENKEDKKMTKTAMNLIEKIEKLTNAYGNRLQTLSTADLKDLYRMLKDRARLLEKERKAEVAAEAKRNAEPKTTAAQRLATASTKLLGYYELATNAKGHLYIKDTETGKTLAKIRANRDGVTLRPRQDMIDALPDKAWEFHEKWTPQYALKVANIDAVWAVLDEYWQAKEAAVVEE